MLKSKEHIFSQLQKEILLLQGFKSQIAKHIILGLALFSNRFQTQTFRWERYMNLLAVAKKIALLRSALSLVLFQL